MTRSGLLYAGMAFLVVPMALSACGGGGATATGGMGGNGAGSSDLPCDVAEILKTHCQSCHGASPVYGATMPLVTYADFHAAAKSDPAKKVYEMVDTRIHSAMAPMPPPPNMPLDTAALDTLSSWIAAGAPKATDNCGGNGGAGGAGGSGGSGGGTTGLSCTPDTKLRAASAFTMPKASQDQYVCFGIDVPVSAKRHITAIAPAIDNKVIVHHMLLFSTDATVDPTPKSCLGQPAGARLLSVWAPGGQALELPTEAGMPMEGTAHFLVQVHYSNLMALDGQMDQSGFDLCTTDKLRANDADLLAFGTMTQIDVPAHGKQDITCDIKVPAAFPTVNAYGVMPHMHKLGTVISGEVVESGGATVPLTNRDPWNFDTQYWDPVTTKLKPNDTIRTRCAWDNPGNSAVKFGETTSDEMCYVFVSYYPRINLPNWDWRLPSLNSTCTPTP